MSLLDQFEDARPLTNEEARWVVRLRRQLEAAPASVQLAIDVHGALFVVCARTDEAVALLLTEGSVGLYLHPLPDDGDQGET